MRKVYIVTCLIIFCSLSAKEVSAQYCIPGTYYGCYSGYMQYTAFTTSGGIENINFSPGSYPRTIKGSNSYPDTCCGIPGEGYAYISNTQCVCNPGSTIEFSLHTSSTYSMYYKIWVDFNGNGSFDDLGEAVYSPGVNKNSGQIIKAVFTVPASAVTGMTRMRVAAVYGANGKNTSSCGNCVTTKVLYGSFTDFNFIISAPSAVPVSFSIFPAAVDEDILGLGDIYFPGLGTSNRQTASPMKIATYGSYHPDDKRGLAFNSRASVFLPAMKIVTSSGMHSNSDEAGSVTAMEVATVESHNVKLFPNPANSIVHIQAAQRVNIVITGPEGKIILIENNATELDISKMAPGIYFARVYDQGGKLLKVEKLLKTGL